MDKKIGSVKFTLPISIVTCFGAQVPSPDSPILRAGIMTVCISVRIVKDLIILLEEDKGNLTYKFVHL